MSHIRICSDCESAAPVSRREFIKTAGAAAVAVGAMPLVARADVSIAKDATPETVTQLLYESLSDGQKKEICFAWDYTEPERGLLRTRIANNWKITEPNITSDFYTNDQQAMIKHIFEGIIQPEWHERIYKQLEDDAGGYGEEQSIAMFGKPGEKFEFVMTGRHMTILRCDGNSADTWPSADRSSTATPPRVSTKSRTIRAMSSGIRRWPPTSVYEMLDEQAAQGGPGRQAAARAEPWLPGFRRKVPRHSGREHVERSESRWCRKCWHKLVEPYRATDRDEAADCLDKQGGLEKCSLAFYSDGDIGNDKVWDCWRLEGPSFVWYYPRLAARARVGQRGRRRRA